MDLQTLNREIARVFGQKPSAETIPIYRLDGMVKRLRNSVAARMGSGNQREANRLLDLEENLVELLRELRYWANIKTLLHVSTREVRRSRIDFKHPPRGTMSGASPAQMMAAVARLLSKFDYTLSDIEEFYEIRAEAIRRVRLLAARRYDEL